MIYITGDTHGEVSGFEHFQNVCHPTHDDYLIVAGDFGCIFGLGWRDENKLDALEALEFTILFLDGNHECFTFRQTNLVTFDQCVFLLIEEAPRVTARTGQLLKLN